MPWPSFILCCIATAYAFSALAAPDVSETPVLTLEGAKQIARAAAAEARRKNAPGSAIAVVDNGGHLLYLERLQGTFAAASLVATGKVRTAAQFARPTRDFEEAINKGRVSLTAVTEMLPLQGGVPVVLNGVTIGAIGVSGAASAAQDDEIAVAAVKVVAESSEKAVTYLPAPQVKAAFEKGIPLTEAPEYKVHASRRAEPGEAEVHLHETDVFYVLSGRATLVSGGALVQPKTVAPGEIRALSVEGGNSLDLAPGDVVIVPKGIPHWFRAVQEAPFLYFVVKPLS